MILSFSSVFVCPVSVLILHILLLGMSCSAKKNYLCPASSCGDIRNISYPFRLRGDPKDCGSPEYELACENNRTVLYLYAGRYYVKSIYYDHYQEGGRSSGYIMIVDDGLQKGDCSSLPRYSLARSNFSAVGDPYYPTGEYQVTFMKCSQPIASASYIDTKPCIDGAHSADTPANVSQMKVYSYAVSGYPGLSVTVRDMEESCTITMMTFASDDIRRVGRHKYNRVRTPFKGFHNAMAEGFYLTYWTFPLEERKLPFCFLGFRYRREGCSHYYASHIVAAKFLLGAPCLMIFLIYKWRRRHLAMDENIEKFLQAHNNFLPIRYSYSDIKKITRNFKHKLGEGGYGSVYKGVLRSGHEVAVKILKNSKSNGQDFISEVGTIGRIHHVNVVQLVGFCLTNSKQALVYDFMLNGSLDKHIFSKDGGYPLDYKKLYDISLGVVRGIAYLHRGCDMQILHFDIKPHNILLDENFTPKVSDFGLAKLYPVDRGIVSLSVVRGTIGYMAPELLFKNIGGVSYKADVYSFGKLLMEMAGKRKNVNANADRSSQIHFPLWVYDRLIEENEVEMEVVEEDRVIIRKMVIVALWCIQFFPNDRPSMSKVLDMLEGDVDKLQLPPKPLLYPPERPADDVEIGIEMESFSTLSSSLTIFRPRPNTK